MQSEEPTEVEKESEKRTASARAIYLNIEAFYDKPQVFSDKAKCAGLPLEWFVISQSDTKSDDEMNALNRQNMMKGLATCVGCPLMYNGECYDKAEPVDLKWTIRGGEIPTAWDQNADILFGTKKAKKTRCPKYHDLTLPGAINRAGRCSVCQTLRAKSHCVNGHDRKLPGAIYSNGSCVECRRIANAAVQVEHMERLKKGRRDRLAKSQSEGVE